MAGEDTLWCNNMHCTQLFITVIDYYTNKTKINTFEDKQIIFDYCLSSHHKYWKDCRIANASVIDMDDICSVPMKTTLNVHPRF